MFPRILLTIEVENINFTHSEKKNNFIVLGKEPNAIGESNIKHDLQFDIKITINNLKGSASLFLVLIILTFL